MAGSSFSTSVLPTESPDQGRLQDTLPSEVCGRAENRPQLFARLMSGAYTVDAQQSVARPARLPVQLICRPNATACWTRCAMLVALMPAGRAEL